MKNCQKSKGVWWEKERGGLTTQAFGKKRMEVCGGRLSGKQGLAVKVVFSVRGEEVIHEQFKSRALVLLRCFTGDNSQKGVHRRRG